MVVVGAELLMTTVFLSFSKKPRNAERCECERRELLFRERRHTPQASALVGCVFFEQQKICCHLNSARAMRAPLLCCHRFLINQSKAGAPHAVGIAKIVAYRRAMLPARRATIAHGKFLQLERV